MASFIGSILLNLLGVITALVAVVFAYFKWSYQYWKRKNLPYFEPTIPFGCLQNAYSRGETFSDAFKNIYTRAKKNGWKHCGIYVMSSPAYFVVDLDMVKNVMTKDFQHFVDRGTYTNDKDDPIASHLFNTQGVKWRNLRAKLTPTFTSGKLKAMFQTLVDCGLVLEQYFKDSVDNRTSVDIKDILARFTTDIIGSCAFGLDCNTFKEPDSPFRIYGKKIFERTRLGTIKLTLATNFPNLAHALGLRSTARDVSDFFTKVVEDTVAYREKNNVARKDFLQLLIDLKNNQEAQENGYKGDGKSLTMPELIAQSFVFFFAGFETSSTTMTFALFLLATHPEIQQKAREEIKTVLAKHNNQISYDSINDLKYLGQVVDETLRLYPPVSILIRKCVEDYKVPGEDLVIEKGTRVLISALGIHHDEDIYKDPEVFDPDRFSDENKEGRHQYAHIPFGEGPRICIGQRFGLMQSKVGLACILRNFRVTLNEKTKTPLKMSAKSFILEAEGGIWLNIEKL